MPSLSQASELVPAGVQESSEEVQRVVSADRILRAFDSALLMAGMECLNLGLSFPAIKSVEHPKRTKVSKCGEAARQHRLRLERSMTPAQRAVQERRMEARRRLFRSHHKPA